MNINLSIKEEFGRLVLSKIKEQIDLCKKGVEDLKDALVNDTKSSAGDKYETSRERISSDLNRLELQLIQYQKSYTFASKINMEPKDRVEVGSLVLTNDGVYLFFLPLGKVECENGPFYSLSITSPIGQLFKNKEVGAEVTFQGRQYKILDVI
ncbi:MAG: hypothetical protein N4A37_08040 [Prolixibacteraceae bacterium]|jgi:ElaB/YqjD/DUF883 family membrane-anchored ribosome-binding protein|nr:hypothetical protein [Prolixibacteraceae bacterium]